MIGHVTSRALVHASGITAITVHAISRSAVLSVSTRMAFRKQTYPLRALTDLARATVGLDGVRAFAEALDTSTG
jgi:hypothetical protein